MISVSKALSMVKHFEHIPPRVLEKAQERGTAVHKYALAYAAGLYLPPPADIKPFFLTFKAWFDTHVAKVKLVEHFLENRAAGLRGRVDLVAQIRGERRFSVIDLKSMWAVHWSIGLQLAAYEYLLTPKHGRVWGARRVLCVTADGKCRAVPFTGPQDLQEFFHCMSLYNHSLHLQGIIRKEIK